MTQSERRELELLLADLRSLYMRSGYRVIKNMISRVERLLET